MEVQSTRYLRFLIDLTYRVLLANVNWKKDPYNAHLKCFFSFIRATALCIHNYIMLKRYKNIHIQFDIYYLLSIFFVFLLYKRCRHNAVLAWISYSNVIIWSNRLLYRLYQKNNLVCALAFAFWLRYQL